jgi:hypothetical protein
MAGKKDVFQSIATQLSSIQVTNQDGQAVGLYVRKWNNQIKREATGEYISYPKPAAFIELVSPVQYEQLSQGFRNADLGIHIHLVHELYDGGNGTFEQDLTIYDLEDQVLVALSLFKPTGCGPLTCITSNEDIDHDNVNEMVLGFVCNFTDSKGSPLDEARTVYTPSVPPLEIEVDESVSQGGGQVTQRRTFLINTP